MTSSYLILHNVGFAELIAKFVSYCQRYVQFGAHNRCSWKINSILFLSRIFTKNYLFRACYKSAGRLQMLRISNKTHHFFLGINVFWYDSFKFLLFRAHLRLIFNRFIFQLTHILFFFLTFWFFFAQFLCNRCRNSILLDSPWHWLLN